MNKTNLKLLIISLFCVLTLSCANLIKNTGDIALNLPSTTERAAEGDTISYNVIVKKSSSGEVIYKTENAINLVIISDIPADNYIIEITGKNKNYLYTGRTTATVTPGNTTSVNIQLEAERIIKSIDVKLIPSLNHIEIGQLITADLFNITENYPDGTSSIVTNKADYNIATEKIDPDQIKCTFTHKKQGISNTVTVPYKSTFPNLTVSLNPTGNIGVAQYSETKELTVTVPTYDTGKYDIAYQWYKADAPIENAVANNFTIPNKEAETVAYTCKVTLTSKSSKVQKTYEPAATANVTVEPWKIILTDPAGSSSIDLTKLESGKSYTVTISNTADTGKTTLTDLKFTATSGSVSKSGSNYTFNSTVTSDTAVTIKALNGTQELATLEVTVKPASGGGDGSGETTPGGGGSTEVTVTTFADLKSKIETGTENIITISNNIDSGATADEGTINVKRAVTIKAGKNITINRTQGATGALFNVSSAGSLTIEGDASGKLIIDGKKATGVNSPLISCQGNLSISNTILQNNINAISDSKGKDSINAASAIFCGNPKTQVTNNLGTVSLQNVEFYSNEVTNIKQASTLSIMSAGSSVSETPLNVTITNCKFGDNSKSNINKNGTIIFKGNVKADIKNTTISYNNIGVNGGGIYLGAQIGSYSADITLSGNTTINNNVAGTQGGGIYINQGNVNITETAEIKGGNDSGYNTGGTRNSSISVQNTDGSSTINNKTPAVKDFIITFNASVDPTVTP